jgi:SAM-dependent methyltransferase
MTSFKLPPSLPMEAIVCPGCRNPLEWSPVSASCRVCGRGFPLVDGIPMLVLDQLLAEHDEVDEHQHKRQQSVYFDRDEAAEFEISRPTGTPALYEWLLRERFRRAIDPIRASLSGCTALTVCGGSGMDAQFLTETGAVVVSADISLGAARRARMRADRGRLQLTSFVADVERLPFADRSIDLVYVHDGLHHLESPTAGLSEMARVARRWVAVTEPARATLTVLAVRFGLALEREEAGNLVARLDPNEVVSSLDAAGFRAVQRDRYLMYYKHRPGILFHVLSWPAVLGLVILGWQVLNTVAGRFGNKLAIIGARIETQ